MAKIIFLTIILFLSGCTAEYRNNETNKTPITVISREDGSGTKKAFSELFGLEYKNMGGSTEEITTEDAVVTNSAAVMMAMVSGNPNAIGYLSLGTPCSLVKTVDIDGISPTIENIKSGKYHFCRPFMTVTMPLSNKTVEDFISYVLSKQGSTVIEENRFVGINLNDYLSRYPTGNITISGSSSVIALMQKLKQEYQKINPDTKITVQQSDSTSGIAAVLDGVCDVGLISRNPTEKELQKGIEAVTIAIDGIAVIVNRQNPINNLTSEQVKAIYSGEISCWQDIIEKKI